MACGDMDLVEGEEGKKATGQKSGNRYKHTHASFW
jgi:hypothetical protein